MENNYLKGNLEGAKRRYEEGIRIYEIDLKSGNPVISQNARIVVDKLKKMKNITEKELENLLTQEIKFSGGDK
ncbi:MAG: hypothetical protein ABH804_00605 [archaeon]